MGEDDGPKISAVAEPRPAKNQPDNAGIDHAERALHIMRGTEKNAASCDCCPARALSTGGRIITIGSGLAERVPFPGITTYAMSKSALSSFTRGLGSSGITVNIVQPGSVDTDANPADGPTADFQRGMTSLGR
jgi:NAD(P)-dependent dehydrogenase (short-subunit alcohol dehydrogenase family)